MKKGYMVLLVIAAIIGTIYILRDDAVRAKPIIYDISQLTPNQLIDHMPLSTNSNGLDPQLLHTMDKKLSPEEKRKHWDRIVIVPTPRNFKVSEYQRCHYDDKILIYDGGEMLAILTDAPDMTLINSW